MTAVAPPALTLLTFAPMVDSETSRLLLARYGIAYHEDDRMVGMSSLLTLFHGGNGLVPLLYGGGVKLTSPLPIAQHFDPLAAVGLRLIPDDAATAAQAMADWATFNGGMGADVAQFAYFHLLPEEALMAPIFAEPVPPVEARLTPPLYPAMRWLIGKLLKLSASNAARAADNMRRTYDETDHRVADRRPFLCGARMTLGDVALAAAAAPLLQPRGYGAKMPPIDRMPAPVLALIEEFQARPTAAFVQRLYDVLRPA